MRLRASSIFDTRVLGLTGSLLAASAGCGLGKDATRWISDDAAVVRCTVAGSAYRLPDLAVELPAPSTPTGLYARVLDPMALDDLGYTRDATVCASLVAPSEVTLSEAKAGLEKVIAARAELDLEARKLGPCACEVARAIGKHDLLASCVGKPWERHCIAKEFEKQDMEKLVAPLETALGEATVPRLHWRLAGPSDRPARFLARSGELLPRHSGGSKIYQRGEPVPERLNHVLISSLLEEDGVIAVVRQDSGTALLVMRIVNGQLVLDHFRYPKVDESMLALLPHVDNAQVDDYRAALAAPAATRKLALDPKDGTLVELDRAALERVDEGLVLSSVLAKAYSTEREQRSLPPVVFDRVTFQVPFGEQGETARAVLRLSEEGRTWVSGMGEDLIVNALDTVQVSALEPALAPGGRDPGFLSRGRSPDRIWFAGAHQFVEIVRAIEYAAAGSIRGSGAQWTLTIPSGPLPGEFFDTPEELKRLRERLSKRRHELGVQIDHEQGRVELTLEPR